MRPLSDECHKALLPVGGTTILGRIMDGLRTVKVADVTVVTGYRADDVEQFLVSRYPDVKYRFVRNERYEQTNNVVSLALALDQLSFDDDILLAECDLLFDPSLLSRLLDHPEPNVALVDRYRTGMDGTVVSVSNGIVTDVFPPHRQGPDFDYTDKFKTINVYRFGRDFGRRTLRPLVRWYAEQVNPKSYYELVLGMLTNIPEHHIAAQVIDGDRWAEVDDPNDLAVARFQFEPDHRAEVLDRAFGGHWNLDVLDFAFMRNAYFPTDAMFAAMRHSLPALVGSYGSAQVVLNEKLGYFLGCEPSRVHALNGASQVFPIFRQMFGPKSVSIPKPTFGEYARTFPEATTYRDAPGVDGSEMERSAGESDVLVIVNPNTPTGTTLPTEEIYSLANRHQDATLIVDESFIAFADQPSIIELLEREPLDNVAVLTSLSKSLGSPGLRLGYLYSWNKELLNRVGEHLPVWNLNAPAEFLLELLLKFRVELQEALEQTKVDRAELREMLERLALVDHVHESGGNYLLVTLAGSDGEIAHAIRCRLLAEFRIDVKNVTDRFPDRAPRLRIAVRRRDENSQLIAALAALEGA